MPGRAPDPNLATPPSPYDDGELYDLIFQDFDLDVAFWREQALRSGGPVLEVACGTGRITFEMAAAGADLDAFDLSAAMLARFAHNAAARGLTLRATPGDMRSFRMPRRYAMVAIPFNAFLHNLTQDDQLATLKGCREHLLPGGRLVMHVSFFGRAIVGAGSADPVLELETRDPNTGHTLRHYDGRTLEPIEQLQHSMNELHEIDASGRTVSVRRSETDVRWVHKPELELLLRASGFTRWKIDGGFDGRPLASEEDQMIVFAWNGDGA
jgi:SAM-dependent methyltransferase